MDDLYTHTHVYLWDCSRAISENKTQHNPREGEKSSSLKKKKILK